MSQPKVLKIIKGEEIRKVSEFRGEWKELEKILTRLYSHKTFRVKYKDEETDMITIENDDELREYYTCSQEPCLRLYVEEVDNPSLPQTLSISPKPAHLGDAPTSRQKPTRKLPNHKQPTLDSFIPSLIESQMQPLKKWHRNLKQNLKKSLHQAGFVENPSESERHKPLVQLVSQYKAFEKLFNQQKYHIAANLVDKVDARKLPEFCQGLHESVVSLIKEKESWNMEVLSQAHDQDVTVGTPFVCRWKIRNTGTKPWTRGLVLVKTSNVEVVGPPIIGTVLPFQDVTITAKLITKTKGFASALWTVQGETYEFGKIQVRTSAEELSYSDLEIIE